MSDEQVYGTNASPAGEQRPSRFDRAAFLLLWVIIFMLSVAGSKTPISWPPTMDPAVACKRPKAATPHPPSPGAREVVAVVELTVAPCPWMPVLGRGWHADPLTCFYDDCREISDQIIAPPPPRYLAPFISASFQNHLSPPL